MLAPDTSQPKRRRFKVYDLEWYPDTLELRMVGCYDGERFTWDADIESFLQRELRPENSGCWYFAHAGGLYDFQFLLEHIIDHRPDLAVDARFSGSSAVAVKIKKGRHEWLFCDSYFLLRTSLAKIGEWLDFPKGEVDFFAPLNELIPYNERDCQVLWKAVDFLQELLLELGGELRPTIASCALLLFKRKYLDSPIETIPMVNECARRAYVASRVEVFKHRCDRGYAFDINSSFPYSMTFPQPGNMLYILPRRMPEKGLFLAQLRICVPPGCYVPPLPYRARNGRVFFPTGIWDGWFSSVDVELALEAGVRIEKVYQSIAFEPRDDAARYAIDIYGRRVKSEGAMKECLKILLNALYGKFGERGEKRRLLINPPKSFFSDTGYVSKKMIAPGIWVAVKQQEVPHAHVPLSAFITAYSRRWLYEYMGETTYYCDTDGFIDSRDLQLDSTELGALKAEGEVVNGRFVAPKLYTYKRGEKQVVKAKGFRRIDYAGFCDVIEHKDFAFEHFMRIPERLAAGVKGVRQENRTKTYRGKLQPKRRPIGGDDTAPWGVEEIEQ